MKTHTSGFKNSIKSFGRQLDSIISYEIDGEEIELRGEELNSITPTFQSDILKSVMKELDIDSNVDIPLETIINYKFGVLVGDEYEYLDFGNYIVYSSEKQEDTGSYKIVCFDSMLRAMTDYTSLQTGLFPMTVREYISNLCYDLSLTFANENTTFCNYDKVIESDLYKDLGYTYRDIFDELAQVTGSTICINNDNEVELRYITETNDVINEEFLKDINVTFGKSYGPINSIVLSRSGESDNVYIQDEESVEENGLHEIKIIDNQIMNGNDRSDYLEDLLDVLDGLEYYINDFSSTGICYYDICDRYSVQIGNTTYSCVMFNDEINVTQGLEENIHTDEPEETQTDYTKADKTDRRINQTYIIVDKQNGRINSLVSDTEQIKVDINDTNILVNNNYQDIIQKLDGKVNNDDMVDIRSSVEEVRTATEVTTRVVEDIQVNGVNRVHTETGMTFDKDGLHIDKSGANTGSTLDEAGLEIEDRTGSSNSTQFYSGYVDSDIASRVEELQKYEGQSATYSKNMYFSQYFATQNGRIENVYDDNYGNGIGVFIG